MKLHDGGPVFPSHDIRTGEHYGRSPSVGMSLRDYFSGQALQGLCTNPRYITAVRKYTKGNAAAGHRLAAESAYRIADAMLKKADN